MKDSQIAKIQRKKGEFAYKRYNGYFDGHSIHLQTDPHILLDYIEYLQGGKK